MTTLHLPDDEPTEEERWEYHKKYNLVPWKPFRFITNSGKAVTDMTQHDDAVMRCTTLIVHWMHGKEPE